MIKYINEYGKECYRVADLKSPFSRGWFKSEFYKGDSV